MDHQKFTSGLVLRAEDALHGGQAEEALSLLEEIPPPLTGHARHLFIEAVRATGNSHKLISFLESPRSISEFIELFNAMLIENQLDKAATLLERAPEFSVDAGTTEGLRSKLQMRILMRKSK
ncbi:hypothetical protein D3C78_1427970 [compost metagenome]